MADAPAATETSAPVKAAHHGPSLGLLAGILLILLGLTYATVAVSKYAWLDFGRLNVWIALLIATVKGTLVALYFMHLRYDKPFNGIVLIAALFFVTLFLAIALQDTLQYQPNLDPNWQATWAPDALAK